MAALSCPKCKAAVKVEGGTASRCGHCGERFHRCRYCVNFDPRIACLHPEVLEVERVIDPDVLCECLYFRLKPPAGKPLRKFLGVTLSAWSTIIAVGVLFACIYLGLIGFTGASTPETGLKLRITEVGTVAADEPFEVTFGIYNDGETPARHITISLGSEALKTVEWLSSDPPAVRVNQSEHRLDLDYGEINGKSALLGQLTFRPRKRGNCPISFLLFSQDAAAPQAVEIRMNAEG